MRIFVRTSPVSASENPKSAAAKVYAVSSAVVTVLSNATGGVSSVSVPETVAALIRFPAGLTKCVEPVRVSASCRGHVYVPAASFQNPVVSMVKVASNPPAVTVPWAVEIPHA